MANTHTFENMAISSIANFTNESMDVNVTVPIHSISMSNVTINLNLVVVSTLISACVCVLNPLTIVTILRTPSLRRCHSNIFLINLAVVDLLFVLMVVILIAKIWVGSLDWVMCIVSLVYLATSCTATMLFCFAIAVDRFLFIHKALTYATIVTHDRVLKVVASVWIISCLTGLMSIMDGRFIWSRCKHESSITVTIQGFTSITMYCITAVISVGLYTKLFFVIREHNKLLECHARAVSGTHNCTSHTCTLQTKLGECRFRYLTNSSFTWSSGDNPANDARVENKRLLFNYKVQSSPTSAPFATRTASSNTFTSEDGVSVSLVDQHAGKTSRVTSQNTKARDHRYGRRLEDKEKDAGPQVVAGQPGNTRQLGQCQHLRDFRTIKALMLMFVIYFICWAPMMYIKLFHQILHYQVSERWMNAAWICAMSNSVWNFVVYPLRKKDFRESMLKMVRRCVGLQPEHRKSRSLPTDSGSDSVQNSLRKSSPHASRLS